MTSESHPINTTGANAGGDDLRQRLAQLEAENARLVQAEVRANRAYDTQRVLNDLIAISLRDLPLNDVLQEALDTILAIPWLSLERSGSIHIVEDEADVLVMKAQRGLANPLMVECARLPFGKCLCGQAALTKELQFANCLDHRHSVTFPGIKEHGHYCAPILYGGNTIGVFNIYTKSHHIRDPREDDFLQTVANTLAVIIVRKKMEQEKEAIDLQLRQAQKMEAIGTLAGGIAHDFNNLLTGILGYTELALLSLEGGAAIRNDLEEVKNLANKSARLTGQLLAFSRQKTFEVEPLDINTLFSSTLNLLKRLIGEEVDVQFVPADDLGHAAGDRGQLEQVLVNLAVNARDAMPGGGRIVIQTENVEIGPVQAVSEDVNVGSYVAFSVTDTGIGMDDAIRQRIFEPFFTTKELGRGTGLGMAMVFGIVQHHSGFIQVKTAPGKGTTVRVLLPRLAPGAVVGAGESFKSSLPSGSGTILLVEDEVAVRSITRRMLERLGYEVLEASGPATARAYVDKRGDEIVLMVSDVVMPQINGPELFEELRQSLPALKVLFISGYTGDMALSKGMEPGANLLAKPFDVGKIGRKIREILGE